jgi:hypothetical protein
MNDFHPADPTNSTTLTAIEHYLYRVAPLAQGWFVSVHIKGNKGGWPGWACASYAEAIHEAEYWRDKGCDVYLSMGGQREPGEHIAGQPFPKANRTHDNIGCLRSLRMDVDAKQYADIAEMDAAIAHFYQETNIPKAPFAVKSGSGGYHLYWPFDRLLSPEEWQPLADALAAAALSTGLKLDTECTVDCTRVLRIPGTKNYKDKAIPKVVEIYYDDEGEFSYEKQKQHLAPYLAQSTSHKIVPAKSNAVDELDDIESIYATQEDEYETQRRNEYELELRARREEIECSLAMGKLLPQEAEKAFTWIDDRIADNRGNALSAGIGALELEELRYVGTASPASLMGHSQSGKGG